MTNLQELRALITKETRPSKYVGPIDLAMVLQSLRLRDVVIDQDGNIYLRDESIDIYESELDYYCEWRLTKDLDQQTPETILSLLTLIKGET